MKINNKRGFTLSEVLIAMAIIGVIAALVVPATVRHFTKSGFESLLGSFYNDFSQAISIAVSENGRYLHLKPIAQSGGLVSNYMQVKKYSETYFADSYESIDGTETINSSDFCTGEDDKKMVITSGAVICITPMTVNIDPPKDNNSVIYLDTNGAESPNIGGKDMFRFNLYSDGSIDEQAAPSVRKTLDRSDIAEKCISSATGEGCFTQFIQDRLKINYY